MVILGFVVLGVRLVNFASVAARLTVHTEVDADCNCIYVKI
jgi:hypothetical protein